MKINFRYLISLFLITSISVLKNKDDIYYHELNNQYVFITDVNALQATMTLSQTILTAFIGFINTSSFLLKNNMYI